MTRGRNLDIDTDIIRKTRCDRHYACLHDDAACDVELYLDRDVQLLRCREKRDCEHRKRYQNCFICTCPVNRASFNLN